jgi:DNA polymerase-3 subunit alpha
MAHTTYTDNIIVFDTETTGLPVTISFGKYFPPSELIYYNNSRIIDIAYIVYRPDGKLVKKVEYLIKPNGFIIENSHIHGISHNTALTSGVDINVALNSLYSDLLTANKIVAHNLIFDINVIMSEAYRASHFDLYKLISKIERVCTMKLAKIKLILPKYPKLTDLYTILFKEKWAQPHRAMADTEICAKCFFRLMDSDVRCIVARSTEELPPSRREP